MFHFQNCNEFDDIKMKIAFKNAEGSHARRQKPRKKNGNAWEAALAPVLVDDLADRGRFDLAWRAQWKLNDQGQIKIKEIK